MKSICFVVNKYPNTVDKNGLVFVQQLVWTLADLGVKCTVICPLAMNLYPKLISVPYHLVELTENGNNVDVYFPKFFGFGQSHYILGKSPAPLTTNVFTKATIKVIANEKLKFDAVYGHFAAPAGVCAARLGRKFGIPSFMAYGESTSWSIDQFGTQGMKKEFDSLSGVIAVSSRNKDLLIEKRVVNPSIVKVFPNGYRPERFYKISMDEARDKLGWDKNKFIVGMVGSLAERKGPLRLQEAVERLDDVYFACAGKGKQIPNSDRCIFVGPIDNKNLLYFYNALDVFVLPTLNEGCCNAIVEAIACGCPIISSDLSFNYDICDETNSILVNPRQTEEISQAIKTIFNNCELKRNLSNGSLAKAEKLTLIVRARNIFAFMENKCYKIQQKSIN